MDKQITGHVMRRLLDTHFESKADMARQLGIQPRTIQRAFEHLDDAKAGTIVLDKAICYCAIHHISLDSILDSFESDAEMEGSPMYEMAQCKLINVLLLKQPEDHTGRIAMYESCSVFWDGSRILSRCKTGAIRGVGSVLPRTECFIGHMAREIRAICDVHGGGDPSNDRR